MRNLQAEMVLDQNKYAPIKLMIEASSGLDDERTIRRKVLTKCQCLGSEPNYQIRVGS